MATEAKPARLDKVLCDAAVGSRKDCEKLVRRGHVTVDGVVAKRADMKVGPDSVILVDGQPINRRRRVVCMLHKSAGYVTSTADDLNSTVMECLPVELLEQEVVPVGRLDKDTEGLLLFTNDGDLLHRLISPKHEVPKVYYVRHEGDVTDEIIQRALSGVELKDGSVCKSAIIKRIGEGESLIRITEGMYHQVKRMYAALGLGLEYLKRVQIGALALGDLERDGVRELDDAEIELLFDVDAEIHGVN